LLNIGLYIDWAEADETMLRLFISYKNKPMDYPTTLWVIHRFILYIGCLGDFIG
jgi:hypothetical protein